MALSFATSARAADPAIDLGSAKAFSVLAGSGITNTGVTNLSGSIGSYETPSITTDTPFVFTDAGAQNEAGNGVTQTAKQDLLVAYNEAAGALPPEAVPAELSRIEHYLPGIYKADTSMGLTTSMTLDGGGRNDGVFVFQIPTTLTTASNSSVEFVNGAQPCNVYWQIGSSATFGTGTEFVGNVLAHVSITANSTATFEGRLLADTGAVTLHSNTFTDPACDTSTGTDTDATDTESDADAVDADSTDTDTDSTDTDTDSTDTDTDTDATDTDTDTDSTDTDTDTDSTDTDTDSDSDTTPAADTDTDTDTSAGSVAGVGTESGADEDSTDLAGPDLPDTGGPEGLLLPYGLIALASGYMLVRPRVRPRTAKHRA